MASIAGKSDQYPMRTLNSRYGGARIYVNCTERSGIVRCYEIHPQLKAGRSSWRICRHASHLFDLQEQLSSLNVKKNHRSAPLVGTLRQQLQLMRMNLSSAYEQKCCTCESMFMLNFPNANVSSEEWCFANDVSYGIIMLLF